uniref:3'-5' exonuclease domain-containing protein n=1 Tax=Tetradesmus obliquus TaxID=3088 RepID=A0A383VDK1_TETOB|eukprot:jgi/Sobl393_1/5537/SZX63638.1
MLLPLSSRHLGGACCSVRKHCALRRWVSNNAVAAAARSAANSDVLTEPPAMGRLSADDLQQYITRHNIQASLVPHPAAAAVAPSQVIKSMVLLVKDAPPSTAAAAAAATASQSNSIDTCPEESLDSDSTTAAAAGGGVAAVPPAVLVLLTDEVRVDERAVAARLGLPRKRLRLASRQEAAAATGYEVGSIPPFGHLQPLRTLVDVSITRQLAAHQQQQQQQLLYAGGGAPNLQLLLSVQQLLAATPAETGTFSELAAAAATLDADAEMQQQQQQQQWATQLPLPWAAGSSEVQLIGVVAQRRRIAKLLLFCSLVPEAVPPLPPDGKSSYGRRLWRHPDVPGLACEVQVIMGKTIERNLGREAAAALMDHIKVGGIVSVRGRVQQNPAAAKDQASGSSSSSRRVLDVVAHEVLLLHKNRDVLSKAVRAAQRQGATGITSAAQLLQLQQQQQQAAGAVDAVLQESRQGTQLGFTSTGNGSGSSSSSTASTSQASTTAGSIGSSKSKSSNGRPPSSQPSTNEPAAAAAAAAAGSSSAADISAAADAAGADKYWQLPPEVAGSIHWVDDEQGIAAMQQLVLPQRSDSTNNGSSSSSSSSSSSGVPDVVVGMDCEWRPYERHCPASPVALLQLATRQHVFLVDLLAICQQQQQQQQQRDAADSSINDSSGSNGHSNRPSRSEGRSSSSVTAAEAALSAFLLCLLCDPRVVKVGFQLASDLDRLQQSYPHLPCFQPGAAAAAGFTAPLTPAGAARLAGHVDLLKLSRAAVPSLVKLPHISSLSKLSNALLGKPLDKTEQTSAWDVRPLSSRQLDYAAKDAAVLTALFDAVLARLPGSLHAGLLAAVGEASRAVLPVTQEAAGADSGADFVVEGVAEGM